MTPPARHCLSHSHVCHEHRGGPSRALMSPLVLVHVRGVVHFPRGGGALFPDFLPDSDCPVELHLSKNRPVMCILLREGRRLSNCYCVGGNPEFTSDSSLLVSRLEYWSREIIFLCVFMKRLVYMLMSTLLCFIVPSKTSRRCCKSMIAASCSDRLSFLPPLMC